LDFPNSIIVELLAQFLRQTYPLILG